MNAKHSATWRAGLILIPFLFGLRAEVSGAPLVISANEGKIDLSGGGQNVITNAPPDSITILDFSSFPPKTTSVTNVPNTVIGPPSNIAVTPDGARVLIANSIKLNPARRGGFEPDNQVEVLDLKSTPPQVIQRVQTGLQPSGMSVTPNGKFALVANRAGGSVTVLSLGRKVEVAQTVELGSPGDSFSDVAIHPNGKLALVSAQAKSYLVVLTNQNGIWAKTGRRISVYGQPYRVIITPDGALALTAGSGFGNGPDSDAVSVVDLEAKPMRTIDYIPIGTSPESIEISPNGRVLAATVINGSNLPLANPNRTGHGNLEIFLRKDKSFVKKQSLPVGAIPEGVAFTSNGRYIVVQCHPIKQLWIFEVKGDKVRDTGETIKVPGMPSSIRAER
jgi:DNA-binding beta-propeller fold protein YncE